MRAVIVAATGFDGSLWYDKQAITPRGTAAGLRCHCMLVCGRWLVCRKTMDAAGIGETQRLEPRGLLINAPAAVIS